MANKELFRLISLALMLALVLTGTDLRVAQADPGWYDAAWAYRKKITVDNTKVSATLTDFPVLISLSSDTDLASDAQDDGDDILFTASDGVAKLSHEIESFNGTSGQLVACVKVPSLSSSADTDIYMYYGHAGAGNQQNATFVWDSNYMMVQHLQETTGGANAIQNSTSNTNHGTDTNDPTLGATGKIDNAITFDGTNDFIAIADSSSLDTSGNITIEAWIKHANMNNVEHIISHHDSTAKTGYLLNQFSNNNFRAQLGNGVAAWPAVSAESTNAYTDSNAWYYVVFTSDGTTWRFYVNGAADGSGSTVSIAASTKDVWIGDDVNAPATRYWEGTIDEVRISDTARTDDWIQVSYNNQQYPDKAVHGASGFFSLGSEDSGAPTAVGGVVYRVNRINVLAPWLFLILALSFAITRGAFQLRKSA
ncbi:DUF2341 domain-containing protein [Chloroflexota bacterium]